VGGMADAVLDDPQVDQRHMSVVALANRIRAAIEGGKK